MLRMTLVFTGFAFTVHVPADEKEHGAQHEGEGSEDEAQEVSHARTRSGFPVRDRCPFLLSVSALRAIEARGCRTVAHAVQLHVGGFHAPAVTGPQGDPAASLRRDSGPTAARARRRCRNGSKQGTVHAH